MPTSGSSESSKSHQRLTMQTKRMCNARRAPPILSRRQKRLPRKSTQLAQRATPVSLKHNQNACCHRKACGHQERRFGAGHAGDAVLLVVGSRRAQSAWRSNWRSRASSVLLPAWRPPGHGTRHGMPPSSQRQTRRSVNRSKQRCGPWSKVRSA